MLWPVINRDKLEERTYVAKMGARNCDYMGCLG